jgi:HK97 family phage major capsid protein
MLKYEIPMQWQTGASYLMNQRTFAQLLTMSDAGGRPMWTTLPGEEPGFRLAGSPVIIASQMPDCMPGSTPVAYGNFKKAYTVVERRQPTLEIDPYTAGWCRLFKFSARIGGATTCPSALRLMRIR